MATTRDNEVRRRLLRGGLRLLGPALLVVVLAKLGDPKVLWGVFKRAGLVPLGAACALSFLVIELKVRRLQALLVMRGFDYGKKAAWRGMLPSLYLGMMTPGRIGDVLRVQYLRHDLGTSYAEGLAVIVMDRLCDLYVLAAFVAAGLAHFAPVFVGRLGLVAWAGVALTVLAPLALFFEGPLDDLGARLYAKLGRAGGADGGQGFLAALRGQLKGRLFTHALPLTLASFLINYLQGWLCARALGIELDYADVISMMAIASLLGLLPISVSGMGVRELFLLLVFPTLGLTGEEGVAFGLLIFVSIYLVCSLAGLVAWQWAPPPIDRPDGGPLAAPTEPRK